MKTRNLAILLFDDAEVLDFAGPYEVFNVANEIAGKKLFHVFTVAEREGIIHARNNFKIIADFSFKNHPAIDILLIPGGNGRKIHMHNSILHDWINAVFPTLEFQLSVCTGSFILGKAGLLKNISATTHHNSFDEFETTFADTKLIRNTRWVDEGKIITAAGVSSGINMSLMVVEKLCGTELANATAKLMEYELS
jgi:transcriptional regulator GlxA family with amidase domain